MINSSQLCGDLVSKSYSANSNIKKIKQIIIHIKTVSHITNQLILVFYVCNLVLTFYASLILFVDPQLLFFQSLDISLDRKIEIYIYLQFCRWKKGHLHEMLGCMRFQSTVAITFFVSFINYCCVLWSAFCFLFVFLSFFFPSLCLCSMYETWISKFSNLLGITIVLFNYER